MCEVSEDEFAAVKIELLSALNDSALSSHPELQVSSASDNADIDTEPTDVSHSSIILNPK